MTAPEEFEVYIEPVGSKEEQIENQKRVITFIIKNMIDQRNEKGQS